MLDYDDPRWTDLKAGYRIAIDLRPLLQRLETSADAATAWQERSFEP